MKKCFTILFFLICNCSLAQYKLIGQVQENITRKNVSFANVFFANTTKGTQTDENGKFAIQIDKGGVYDLVVSFIGYETLTVQIKVDTLKTKLILLLNPKANELQAVDIRRMKNGFERYYELFKDNFIGKTNFSKSCKLKNPRAIWFVENQNGSQVQVNSDEVLLVENKALGYIIKYQLEDFVYDFSQNFVVLLGFPLFEEMKGSQRQQEKWQENRQKAYLGSSTHFLTSLTNRNSRSEGFTIQKLIRQKRNEKNVVADSIAQKLASPMFSKYMQYLVRTPYTDDQLIQKKGIETYLTFSDFIYITYNNEDEELQLMENPSKQNYQVSIAHLQDGTALLGPNGYMPDPLALVVEGRWGFEKLGELLPLDYVYQPKAKK
jgi:hypothetical protein